MFQITTNNTILLLAQNLIADTNAFNCQLIRNHHRCNFQNSCYEAQQT